MRLINFDKQFEAYTAKWIQENSEKHKNNLDIIEAQMPDIYAAWLDTPADWLDGTAPGAYFAQQDDAETLVEWMIEYFRGKVPVPDQLLERITELSTAAESALLAIVVNQFQEKEARLTAISLLSEMESTAPMAQYIEWISVRKERDELADMAADALLAMGEIIKEKILDVTASATPAGQEAFADILCNFPGDERIFAFTHALFLERKEKRALFASLLGKLGDDRALPALREAASAPAIGYLDFIELRNALEALGGDTPEEPEFSGDPFYESLRGME